MNEAQEPAPDHLLKPSKTQLKQESAALQDMAADMAKLSASQLQALNLPDKLFNALSEAAAMPPKGARKRLLKYIGGLLRDMDAEAIKEKLLQLNNQSVHSARVHHKIENWRDRLLNEDDSVLTEFLHLYPHADRQQLRQLLRNAKKEVQLEKPPRYARLLFRYLKQMCAQESSMK